MLGQHNAPFSQEYQTVQFTDTELALSSTHSRQAQQKVGLKPSCAVLYVASSHCHI